ncbi:CFEM domain-containing protein [Apiospora phragmitis]|uniref:CFEM domain-containing protein n=1 Tax=Apiospora phragmitis TaxID=2905665 RepID=A0ABR1WVB5_9PEZI
MIIALPLPLIRSLNAGLRKKFAITVVLLLGIFISISACLRLHYLILSTRSTNPTWDYTDFLIWTALEVDVSVIVISLPAIRAFATQILPDTYGSFRRASETSDADERRLTTMTKISKQSSCHRRKLTGFFTPKEPHGDATGEGELELGDRLHGTTHTEIGTTDRTSKVCADGIRVKRTMTTTTSKSGRAGRTRAWNEKSFVSLRIAEHVRQEGIIEALNCDFDFTAVPKQLGQNV